MIQEAARKRGTHQYQLQIVERTFKTLTLKWKDYKEAVKRCHWRQAHDENKLQLYRISPLELMNQLRDIERDLRIHEMKVYMYHEIECSRGAPTENYFIIRNDISAYIRSFHRS